MDIEQKVIGIIADELEENTAIITPKSDLQADLGADSVDNVSILTHINHSFDIKLGEADVADVRTVGDIIQLIERKTADKT